MINILPLIGFLIRWFDFWFLFLFLSFFSSFLFFFVVLRQRNALYILLINTNRKILQEEEEKAMSEGLGVEFQISKE